MINFNNVKIFSGNSNVELAKKIAEKAGLQLGKAEILRFKDGEVYIEIEETVRGRDVFVVQSTSEPVNENLMELLIFVDALKRASAKTINVIIPYYGYARQDRKSKPREPITSKLVANLLTTAGVNRVIAMDLHADQIQGFFDIPVDHMQALPLMAKYFKEKGFLGVIDTAGTITNGADAIAQRGAKEVYACCSHAVFSDPAIERLEKSALKEVIVTDSIALPERKKIDKIKILSVDSVFAAAMDRIINNKSVSELFE